jgi:hypothetical protein
MTEESKELKIGTKMIDGSIYAGISPDTHEALYVMTEDAGVTMTSMNEQLLEDHEINDNACLTMDFHRANRLAKTFNKLSAYGHDDWRLPTAAELEALQKNKDEGALKGTFNENTRNGNTGSYWSEGKAANTSDSEDVYRSVVRFSDGRKLLNPEGHDASVRYVRSSGSRLLS